MAKLVDKIGELVESYKLGLAGKKRTYYFCGRKQKTLPRRGNLSLCNRNKIIMLSIKRILSLALVAMMAWSIANTAAARVWTLKECLDHADKNAADILKLRLQKQQADISVKQQQGMWLPSVSASASGSLGYMPFLKGQSATINGTTVSSSVDKTSYNGSYGINAAWTLYDGNQRTNNIRLAKTQAEAADLQTDITLNQIKEQVVQLYIQALYSQEALKINKELLQQDSILYRRGQALLDQGQIAKYELLELQTQVSNGQYDIVSTQTQIDQYKLQIKQLIYADPEEEFDIADLSLTDQEALSAIPTTASVYEQAAQRRPEIKNANLSIKQAQLNYQIARAGWLPTLSLSAGLGANHSSGSDTEWFTQMKRSFDASIGFTLSIPIFDRRQTRSSVQKADIEKTIARLDSADATHDLYYTIDNYRLNAYNNQQKFIAGQDRLDYNQQNYDAIFQKAQIGTMNIVETLNARSSLLSARQDALQSKYLTIYNKEMLQFYATGQIFKE